MKDVLILASRRSLVQKAEHLITEDGIDRVAVQFCKNIDEIVHTVSEDLPDTVEIILAMPGTALLIGSVLKDRIPVLPIEYNNLDIIRALQEATSLCPGGVALGHYLEENSRIEDITQMTGRPFVNFLFGNDDHANRNILQNLRNQGVAAVVGGGYICNLAQEQGFFVFPQKINLGTLRKTIRNGLAIADTRRYARYSRRNIDIILEYQSDAVMTVDQDNEVTFLNKSAETMFSVTGTAVVGKKSWKVFSGNRFESVLKNRETLEDCQHTIHGVDIIGDYRPVFDNGRLIGVVGTFSTVMDIVKKENRIRKSFLPKKMHPRHGFDEFRQNGPAFQTIVERARCFACTDETVLITGESGTGKEVMAGSIHNASIRREKPFLAVNCASIPATLMESELFGYEAGAFTGGKKNGASGMFESAHGGTIFLDEIGEMPFELQAKLLRVIQEREVRRIGSSRVIPVDVRIIAATNKVLEDEVAARRFRADLYYRLNVLHIHMPPLRNYSEHAGQIAEKMLMKMASDTDSVDIGQFRDLLARTAGYDWPGNLRELENFVRRYVALSPYLSRTIQLDDIFTGVLPKQENTGRERQKNNDLQEIMEVFHRMGGNRTLTARELGISRSTLWRKLKAGYISSP